MRSLENASRYFKLIETFVAVFPGLSQFLLWEENARLAPPLNPGQRPSSYSPPPPSSNSGDRPGKNT